MSASSTRRPSFRLLYNSTLTSEEIVAASRGLERFSAYGLLYDRMELSRQALKGVRRKDDIMMAVGSDKPLLLDENWFLRMGFLQAGKILLGKEDMKIGIGLTAQPMAVYDSPEHRKLVGVSRFDSGAVVSVARMREFYGPHGAYRDAAAGLYPDALKYAVMHEVGHILIDRKRDGDWALDGDGQERKDSRGESKSHCPNKDCVMQENDNVSDFVERFVRRGLDFCSYCSMKISARLNEFRF